MLDDVGSNMLEPFALGLISQTGWMHIILSNEVIINEVIIATAHFYVVF